MRGAKEKRQITDENVVRTHFAPEHVYDGKIQPAAVSLTDLSDRGYSLDREKYSIAEDVERRMDLQSSRKPNIRQLRYVSRFETNEVNSIPSIDGAERGVHILCDPIPGNLAHAILLSADKRTKSQLRALRKDLIPILETTLQTFTEWKGQHLQSMPIMRRSMVKSANAVTRLVGKMRDGRQN